MASGRAPFADQRSIRNLKKIQVFSQTQVLYYDIICITLSSIHHPALPSLGSRKNKLKTHWTTLSSHSCSSPKPASAAGIEPSNSVSSGFPSLNTPTMMSARAAFSSPNECRAMGASQLKINCEKLENVSRKLTYVN